MNLRKSEKIDMKSQKVTHHSEGRCLGVIDIENLVGGSDQVCPRKCKALWNFLEKQFGHLPIMWVAATGVQARRKHVGLPFDFPGVRFLVRAGVDGADMCLSEVLASEPASHRSARIIIVGGDGRTVPAATDLKAKGCSIIVVGIRGTISRKLLDLADEVHYYSPYAQVNGNNPQGGI